MKVVHLNTSDTGGAAMAAINLHLALLEQGVGSHLLTLNRTRTDLPGHAAVDPFLLRGTPIRDRLLYKARRALELSGLVDDRSNTPFNRNLRTDPGGLEIFTLPYSWFDVLQHPLVQQADLVHLHWVGYGMIDHRRFFGRCTKPIVWTMHDMNPFTAGSHHTDGDLGFREGPDRSPQLRQPHMAARYWNYKHAAVAPLPPARLKLVAPSQWLAAHAESSAMFRGRRVAVIPNGFDTAVFRQQDRSAAREALGLPRNDAVILFNAQDVDNPRKGMPLLLEALQGNGLGHARLLCIGSPGKLARTDRSIHFTGQLNDTSTIARCYAAADLFVLPSLAENLPNTVAEAHLCGIPVVAFRVGGIPEQVHAGNGLLAEPRNVADLGQSIAKALRTSWNNAAIAVEAAARYDRRTVAQAYRTLYTS